MPTLSQTTSLTKKILLFGGIGIVGIILIVLLVRGGIFLMNTFFPKPGPLPLSAFDILPSVRFPEQKIDTTFTYQIDTVTNTLGNFSDRANVYKINHPTLNLLNLSNARALMSQTNFNRGETKINDTTYRWTDERKVDKTLTLNIVSKDFSIASNFYSHTDLLAQRKIVHEDVIESVTDLLSQLSLYPLDLDISKTKVKLLKVASESASVAEEISDQHIARVDFFQSDVNKTPIVYPDFPHSTMNFIVGGTRTTDIVEGSFTHQTISDESSDYPLISVEKAYEILKDNKGYIAGYFGNESTILIKKVYLGYYLGEQKQEYLMPVYVFEGKDGFLAYVMAVDPSWTK